MNPTALLAKVKALRRLKKAIAVERESRDAGNSAPLDLPSVWTPNKGPQTQFFESECREVLYGGAAGGGKSAALTALPLRWAHLPGFLSLTLRRESTQLKDLLGKAGELYRDAFPSRDIVNNRGRETFSFPAGGHSLWGHCKEKRDHKQYDGWEIHLLNFDELTHFTEQQYKYICARVRSSKPGYPTLIRATTNPGGEGHDWVFKHWGAWLDPDFEAEGLPPKESRPPGPPAKPGEVWWIRTKDGVETYFQSDQGIERGKPKALSRTFIPAKLEDNPYLFENDPEYVAELETLDAVRRAQLRDGNWTIKPTAGLYFNRLWCEFVDRSDVPPESTLVRFWDRAGTEKTAENDPDFTCGTLLARLGPTYWVVDSVKGQWSPAKVDDKILETAKWDRDNFGGRVIICVAQDPGQAGKAQAIATVQQLSGFRVHTLSERGSKLSRFGPFSSQAEHHNVRICRGTWNESYIRILEDFDGSGKQHDDDVDATSGAFRVLNIPRFARNDGASVGIANAPERYV